MLPHPKVLPLVREEKQENTMFFVNITIITTSTFKAYYWEQFFLRRWDIIEKDYGAILCM